MKESGNIRGSPRLLFTKEELEAPELEKPIEKVQKAQKKYDSAQKKLMKHRHAVIDQASDGSIDSVPVSSEGRVDQSVSDAISKSSPEKQFFHRETKKTNPEPESLQNSTARKTEIKTKETSRTNGRKASYKVQHESAAKPDKVADIKETLVEKAVESGSPSAAASVAPKATRLVFEKGVKERPSKMQHSSTVVRTINTEIHRNAAKANEDDNVAATASLKAEEKVESALRMGDHAYHARKLRPYRQMEKAEKQLDKVNVRFLQAAKENENPNFTSNPYSRWQQKRAIRREYAAAKAGKGSSTLSSFNNARKKTEEAVSDVKTVISNAVQAIRKRPGKLLLLGLLGGMLLLIMGAVQSCTPLAQSVLESVVIGTYPATEDDVRAAERAYLAKEQDLKYEMDHYKDVHPGYDEYHVEQDEIWHNPYVLIAIISAYYDGQEWDMDKAMPVIEKYFKLQYRVTEEVTTEIRYRTETQSGTRWVTDPDTGQQKLESYTYEEDVPYEYTICNVTLENYDLSHTPVISMSHHTMGMYALYMATHGNMEGIFHGKYAVPLKDPYIYDIPQETLDADPMFAKLMEEANKYVGYPYVWGGASPETSFDCSGFVSYVFTASGVYNTGRLGANGLHSLCRTVSEDEVRPGDLVFFEGTMGEKVGGITHVGIYVGNHHMIHCGSPCGYADLNDHYWVQHFHSYGRVLY